MAAAMAIAQSLRSVLFDVAPVDPLSLIGVAEPELTTSGAACYPPARRASRLDPMSALRVE